MPKINKADDRKKHYHAVRQYSVGINKSMPSQRLLSNEKADADISLPRANCELFECTESHPM